MLISYLLHFFALLPCFLACSFALLLSYPRFLSVSYVLPQTQSAYKKANEVC